jgi:hypothetical protein
MKLPISDLSSYLHNPSPEDRNIQNFGEVEFLFSIMKQGNRNLAVPDILDAGECTPVTR